MKKFFSALIAMLSITSSQASILEFQLDFLEGQNLEFSENGKYISFGITSSEFIDYKFNIVDAEVFLDFDSNTATSNRHLTMHLFGETMQYFGIEPGQMAAIERGGNWQNPNAYLGYDVGDYWVFQIVGWPYDGRGQGGPLDPSEQITFGSGSYIRFSDKKQEIYVPEPETFALFLLGAVGMCVRRQL